MNKLITRTLSGLVFVIIFIGSLLLGLYPFAVFLTAVTSIGLYELYRIIAKHDIKLNKFIYFAIPLLILIAFVAFFNLIDTTKLMLILICLPSLVYIVFEFFNGPKDLVKRIPWYYFSLIYIIIPIVSLILIYQFASINIIGDIEIKGGLVFILLILIWANDIFAYLSGSLIGKHKLYPSISPGKTWEGSIGGLIFTLAFSLLLSYLINDIAFYHFLILAFLVSFLSTIGDLFESALKRSVNIKDSGNIMPGHGGILDRFDSLFFAAPFFVVYVVLFMV